MARIDDKLPKQNDLGLAAYSKQFYDSPSHQAKIREEEREVERREKATQKNLELIEKAREKAIERIEKQQEKQSDRWFSAKLLLIGATIGALITLLIKLVFK